MNKSVYYFHVNNCTVYPVLILCIGTLESRGLQCLLNMSFICSGTRLS